MNKHFIPILVILLPISSSFIGISYPIDYLEQSSMPTFYDGNTLYVGGDGPGNYSKIQDAIDNASDGDTVFVYNDSSPYYENVNVEKSIILIGEERNSTVIDGGGIDSVIEVSADHVHIEGFTVTNCRDDLSEAGINIFSDWNAIKNSNIVENQCMGIRLYGSNHNLIENNILKDNTYYNIYLGKKSNNNTVQNNTLTADNWPYVCNGIWLDKSSNNLIENNEITGLKFIVGISLYERSSYNVVEKNIIYNNPCYGSGASIQIAGHSDFNLISNNEIRCNNGAGITMFFSQGNEIIGNTIDSLPYQGVTLCDCRYNNIIKFNNISSTDKGIQIGVYSSKNTIESNNLINNSYGIYLSGTDLLGFVPNNVISKNNIVENNYGIYITVSKYYGPSNDNLIYHNNFINNTNQAHDECDNTWDDGYPSGGNYWSDFDETSEGAYDNNSDDIVDTPYNISGGNNQDRYPLIFLVNIENSPPSKPVKPSGETSGKTGEEHTYSTSTTDPDGDQVWYKWDWGDGNFSGWLGPYDSGETVEASHTWNEKGRYEIKVKAKDIFDAEGPWSDPLPITMPKNKAINIPFLQFLQNFFEKFPNAFPILRHLMGL